MSGRIALVIVCGFLAIGAVAPATASADGIAFKCFAPGAVAIDCGGWHATPVTLVWLPSDPTSVVSGCVNQTFSHDAALITASCETDTAVATVKLHVDMTPPALTGATTDRAADHAGWWNHPVAVTFHGADATSGIASCDTVVYSQPDSSAGVATGGCRDRAGNAAAGSFTLAYDATPPRLAGVSEIPGDRRVMLRWEVSGDTAQVAVVRSPGTAGARSSSIYDGRAAQFTDRAAANGRTYLYTVTAFDAAGNSDSATVHATPSALLPRAGRTVRAPPFLRWHPTARARYYNVQLFRGSHKILSTWPTRARLRLHRAWTFGGDRHRLDPGRYRWYVWPGFGSRASHHYGPLIGRSTFRLVR